MTEKTGFNFKWHYHFACTGVIVMMGALLTFLIPALLLAFVFPDMNYQTTILFSWLATGMTIATMACYPLCGYLIVATIGFYCMKQKHKEVKS